MTGEAGLLVGISVLSRIRKPQTRTCGWNEDEPRRGFWLRGAGFKSLSDGIDTTTASGKLVFHIMGALAEFERSLISERTSAGMKAAKRRAVTSAGRRNCRRTRSSMHGS
jgi:hypothetical protein